MAKQSYFTINFLLLVFIFGFGSSTHAKNGSEKAVDAHVVNAKVLIANSVTRSQLASQPIEFNLSGTQSRINLSVGKVLKDYSLKVTSRKVSVNSKEGFLWIEATLLDKSENKVAYLTATVPDEKFSIGVGFKNPEDPRQQLVLMIDTTGL